MAPKRRRSCRLKANLDSKGIGEGEGAEKREEESDVEEKEALDLEALVSQTYEFMVSKARSSAGEKVNGEKNKPEETNSVLVDLPDGINLSSSKGHFELSSELQTGLEQSDLYFNLDNTTTKSVHKPVCSEAKQKDLDKLMKKSVITEDFEKLHTVPPISVSSYKRRKLNKQANEQTAGPKWFNLPATTITPEIECDLKLLKLRNVLDPKRHYKKNDSKELPKYFQIGTVVEGAAEFYSSRLPKRERRSNIVNELLADSEFRRYNKKKFLEIQAMKQSGRKGFYKQKMNKRKPNWARH